HERNGARVEEATQLRALIERQIRNDEPGYSGARGGLRQTLVPESQQRIQIAHEQQRSGQPGMGSPQALQLLQDPTQADSLRESRLAGALNGDTVRHRIGERHTDLDDIGPGGYGEQMLAEALPARITGRQERHQSRLTLGGGLAD